MKEISPRLAELLQWVPQDSCLIDIGCDHGWLPIYALSTGRITQAIAVDRAQAPLDLAQQHAQGLSSISFVLSDGLDAVDVPENSVVNIAGMGGLQMRSILERAPLHKIERLLLQPNRDGHILRSWLAQQGWYTSQASVVQENGRFFLSWCAQRSDAGFSSPAEEQWHWQEPWFVEHSSSLFQSWLHDRLLQIHKTQKKHNHPEPLQKEADAIAMFLERLG